jgi:hypothetical protein
MTSHFYKETNGFDSIASKYIIGKLDYLFDYTKIEDANNMNAKFGVNLETH